MNLLEFIRKRVLNNKAKFFDQNAKILEEKKSQDTTLGEKWDCKLHDKALLRAFSTQGSKNFVSFLNNSQQPALPFEVSDEFAQRRIELVCEILRELAWQPKEAAKTAASGKTLNQQKEATK